VRAIRLNSARLANDAPEEFVHCAIIERAGVDVSQTRQHKLFAIRIVQRQLLGSLQRADFQS
jgi:hypothetical protein